jgi:CubicO group peptidase (beta-lactamase class C family)
MRKRLESIVFGWLLIAFAASVSAQTDEVPVDLEELEARLIEILEQTHTPGLGITLVSRDAVIWEAGLGSAKFENDVEATPETLFRIGSISKMFVALAVLRLVERGRLDLDDRVRDLVPEIEFENPWSETDPVRLVHLLEHTAGFDDIHLVEFANSDPTPLSLKEGLAFHPHSRTVRWRPGTRFSYSNSGPAVAAYIVEKVTDEQFEEYVEDNIFRALGMTTASHLLTDTVRKRRATLYVGGTVPTPYWHLLMRPSGSINASARDMSPFVRMLINRGELGGARIVREASIRRMETPESTLGAEIGLQAGYGLANYSSVTDGFVFRGHNGGMTGGLADLGYLPEHGLGYALMINSDNGAALRRMMILTRRFLTRDLEPPELTPGRAVPPEIATRFAGVYRQANPRQEMQRFLTRLSLARLSVEGERLTLSGLAGPATEFVAMTDRLARRADQSITSLALLDGAEGQTEIQIQGASFVKVPVVVAWLEIAAMLVSFLLMASAVVFGLVWGPRRLFGRLRGRPGIAVRAWPLLTVALFVASIAVLVAGAVADPLSNLGRPTLYSVGFTVSSIAFFAAACCSVYVLARSRPIAAGAYWHSVAVIVANAWIAGYLLYWGIIGLRLWSY